jgi:PadR family transcriptional regulator PadR
LSCVTLDDVCNTDIEAEIGMAQYGALGEFEHLVLLAVLRHPDGVIGSAIGRELEERAGRRISRGALYSALVRLEEKGYLRWQIEGDAPERGGHPRRRFRVTKDGRGAVTDYQRAVKRLLEGVRLPNEH